jgi:hypothetical protein
MELQPTGLITLSGKMNNYPIEFVLFYSFIGFLLFWGIIFAISTTLVALIKDETDESYELNELHLSVLETYKILGEVLRLPPVRSMALILLTVKVRNNDLLIFFLKLLFRLVLLQQMQ